MNIETANKKFNGEWIVLILSYFILILIHEVLPMVLTYVVIQSEY
jgi:hypothetical protein